MRRALAGLTLRDLEWAAGVYDSRRFPARLACAGSAGKAAGDDKGAADGRGVMVPLLDMGNHHPGSTVRWDTDGDGNVRFHLSDQGLRVGDEVFNHYGDKGNEELLMTYGFALEANPHDSYPLMLAVAGAPSPAPRLQLGPFIIQEGR